MPWEIHVRYFANSNLYSKRTIVMSKNCFIFVTCIETIPKNAKQHLNERKKCSLACNMTRLHVKQSFVTALNEGIIEALNKYFGDQEKTFYFEGIRKLLQHFNTRE